MVRGEWVRKRDGSRVWREWAPQTCPVGHAAVLRPTWTALPCGCMGRAWECSECGEVTYDPDHECKD